MPQYSATAFQWSGTGYNALYNTSYTATIDDDDSTLDGASDTNETVSINGGAFNASTGQPYDIDISFTDVNGDPHVETFYFVFTNGSWYFIPGPGSEFSVGATLGSYQSHTTTGTPYSTITCFVRGTLIDTKHGLMPVEDIQTGTEVLVANGCYKPLRRVLSRKIRAKELQENTKLAPVRIMAGAIALGVPSRDLLVSRQHRMLISSNICERMFGEPEALVAAIKLTELPGIHCEPANKGMEYFHLFFDQHEVIFAEGAPTESFYPGPEALKALSPEARTEISCIFPEVDEHGFEPKAARYIPSGKRQKALIARHLKNRQPMLQAEKFHAKH
ncbi:Hint domain-containing protein [Octadecabacter temperatus]|uniref:Uncharacterized protein n=1 Tax=Octadecabacter temperatus TaxID=1458307 RepID=A0A0K0Y6A7_9RHOB|nr:Hint domain-containing protein [Octadecabacter temperatus]AKS46377.1 hypothetical protein OSB_18360 [Octadecabacter temperatus]SIO12854.1 Hint domain-containing protein [Octadecabacter temperatus]